MLTKVKASIGAFEKRFDHLKKVAIKLLQKYDVEVKEVVYELSTLSADEKAEHKVYLKENLKDLKKCDDHWELFGSLNLYWNYLSYHLLDHLIKQLPSLKDMEGEMELYKGDLQVFRVGTPLELFRKTQREHIEPPAGFSKIVAEFKNSISKDMRHWKK